MRTVNKRAWVILVYCVAVLLALALLFSSLVIHADDYAMNGVNAHLYRKRVLLNAGDIVDRNGDLLNGTRDEHRIYSDDPGVRKATLHLIGDPYGYISTGIQSSYRAELAGYSLVGGVPRKDADKPELRLTVDAGLCDAARRALDGYPGAIMMYNYQTGEILCETSAPYYDPENVPDDLLTNGDEYDGVFINRALRGLYVPGSIFKIVTAAAAIENIPDIYDREFYCPGETDLDGGTVVCNGTHGTQSFREAFANSCNCAFCEIANELGEEIMTGTVRKLGLLDSVSIDRVDTSKGYFDVAGASDAELGWAGVGQHTTLINPAAMMMLAGAVANGGKAVTPYSVAETSGAKTGYRQLMSAETAARLKEMMRNNVENHYGDFGAPSLEIGAKTGTAETGENSASHAWLCGFCASAEHPLAFICVMENAGSGIRRAGGAMSEVFEYLLYG